MFVTRLSCAKTAERLEILFGVETLGDPRHVVLDADPDPRAARGREIEEHFIRCKV